MEIVNCTWPHRDAQCPRFFCLRLRETADENVRVCESCLEPIHLCRTPEEAERRKRRGERVAKGYLDAGEVILGTVVRKVVRINGLPLPSDLLDLIDAGLWRMPQDTRRFEAVFPEHGHDAAFHSLQYMPIENKFWRSETARMFLGTADPDLPPGDIDPQRSVLVADLGRGFDQPIALDYRTHPPRVLTLRWSQPPDDKNRWVVVAPNIRAFADIVGLTSA
jgi:hypothetical protein